jgi:DNA replication licensing factor MCM5
VLFCNIYAVLQLEEAAKEVADEITAPRPEGETVVQDIQVLLKSDANSISVRDLKVWRK